MNKSSKQLDGEQGYNDGQKETTTAKGIRFVLTSGEERKTNEQK
jgi:hypothetical protein